VAEWYWEFCKWERLSRIQFVPKI